MSNIDKFNAEVVRWFGKIPDSYQAFRIKEIVEQEKKRVHALGQRFTEWDWAACVSFILHGDRDFTRYIAQ